MVSSRESPQRNVVSVCCRGQNPLLSKGHLQLFLKPTHNLPRSSRVFNGTLHNRNLAVDLTPVWRNRRDSSGAIK